MGGLVEAFSCVLCCRLIVFYSRPAKNYFLLFGQDREDSLTVCCSMGPPPRLTSVSFPLPFVEKRAQSSPLLLCSVLYRAHVLGCVCAAWLLHQPRQQPDTQTKTQQSPRLPAVNAKGDASLCLRAEPTVISGHAAILSRVNRGRLPWHFLTPEYSSVGTKGSRGLLVPS